MVTDAVGTRMVRRMAYSGLNVQWDSGRGVVAWVKRNMARSNKSFSELQRQSIGVELARREADSRKQASNWQSALDDVVTPSPASKVDPTDR